jgi:hypothetical protein
MRWCRCGGVERSAQIRKVREGKGGSYGKVLDVRDLSMEQH